ncbi:MAG: phage head closure protein [Sporichthyaceae bacterium]|nr:phage head closure protein [Sporichthyaceae bacterium]
MVTHRLNRLLEVWRQVPIDDGIGGQSTQWTHIGTVRAQVSQPSARERVVAEQAGSRHDHIMHLAPRADVRRGDQLRGDGQALTVVSVLAPSRPVYLRAECSLDQAGE